MGLKSEELEAEVERMRSVVAAHERGDFDDLTWYDKYGESPDKILPPGMEVTERTMNYGPTVGSYTGHMVGDARHGKGRHTDPTGDYYDGEWKYDMRDGQGKMVYVRGLEYEGQWKANKTHGHGRCKYENGGVYEGDWKDDHRWGWGVHSFPDGSKYEGEWFDDIMEGKGCWTDADGSYYEGEFGNGQRTKGKWVAADGSMEYVGNWRGVMRHGYGVCHQKGLMRYNGMWKDDKEHSSGKCVYQDGSSYDGQWKDGLRHGTGKYAFGPVKYDGDWLEGKQHGKGSAMLANGDRYAGQWQEGKRHGVGRLLAANSDRYEGGWANDMRCGKGTCEYANGDKYTGEWKDGKRHGFGLCRFADGVKYRGQWEEDGCLQSAANPELCRITGAGLLRATAGQQANFGIQARDDLGNRRLVGGDHFEVELRGPATLSAAIADAGDGTYLVTYTTTVAGQYAVHIQCGPEDPVADSPYPLRVVAAAPSPRRSCALGQGHLLTAVGIETEFLVEPRDQYGNRCITAKLEQMLPLEVALSCAGAECPVSVSAGDEDGRYRCCYTPARPGFYRLQLTSQGTHLLGSPFSIHVKESLEADAPVDAAIEDAAPVADKIAAWQEVAAQIYAADGFTEGWESDDDDVETAEEKFIRENPDVPVVTNLEDMWLVNKQIEAKKIQAKKEKRERLAAAKAALKAKFGAPPAPTVATPAEIKAKFKTPSARPLLPRNLGLNGSSGGTGNVPAGGEAAPAAVPSGTSTTGTPSSTSAPAAAASNTQQPGVSAAKFASAPSTRPNAAHANPNAPAEPSLPMDKLLLDELD